MGRIVECRGFERKSRRWVKKSKKREGEEAGWKGAGEQLLPFVGVAVSNFEN